MRPTGARTRGFHMRPLSKIVLTLAASTLLAGFAAAKPELDAAGKCRDNGKFVAKSMCQSPAPAGNKCRDIKTKKFAKCGTPNTEPVPSSGAAGAAAPPK